LKKVKHADFWSPELPPETVEYFADVVAAADRYNSTDKIFKWAQYKFDYKIAPQDSASLLVLVCGPILLVTAAT